MKWFLNLLKGIWRGITKAWSWVASKIKNIFSSSKNHSTEPEKTKTEGQNQQQVVVVTRGQNLEPAADRRSRPDPVQNPGPTTHTIKLPTSLIGKLPYFIKSLAHRLPDDVKSFILQDESISGLIKNYPTAFKIFMCKNRYFFSCDRENLEDNERFKKRLSDFSFCVHRFFKKDEELSVMFDHSEMEQMGSGNYPRTYLEKYRENYLLHLLEHLAKSNRKTPVSKLPDNIWSFIGKSRDDVKYFMLQDESILESMKKYPKLCEAFANIECVYDVYKHGDIKSLFSNQSILELLEKDDELRSILIGEQIFSQCLNFNLLIDLLKHSSGDKSIFELIKKCPGAFFIFMHCNPASEGIKQFTKEDIERFTKRLSCYLSSISELIEGDEGLINALNNQEIFSGKYLNYGNNLYDNRLVNLLMLLARRDEAMLNRIKNHSELARAVFSRIVNHPDINHDMNSDVKKEYTGIFDTLFSHYQGDVLEKLGYDLSFTMSIVKNYVKDMRDDKRFILRGDYIFKELADIMLCLRNKEDIELLKSIFHDVDSIKERVIFNKFSTGSLLCSQQKLIEKFFEHHYNNPYIYKMAIKLGGIDLGVRINAGYSNEEGKFPYHEESKTYQVHLPNNYTSKDIDTVIDRVLEEHFKRIKEIVKKRLPSYLEVKLPNDLIPNIVNLADEVFDLNKPHHLKQICLIKIVESLNR